MHKGKITKLFRDKEYGMIRSEAGEEILFHKQCLWDIPFDALTDSQEVEFEIQTTHKGLLGFHIRPHVSKK